MSYSLALLWLVTYCYLSVEAGVPGPPQSARVRIIDDNTLEVFMVEPPIDDGGSNETHYNISLYFPDISSNRPVRSSGQYGAAPASNANDGDFGRTYPNLFHGEAVAAVSFVDSAWWGVNLASYVHNPFITVYARDCCIGNFGGQLEVWIGNDWPSNGVNWNNWNAAKKCGTLSNITDSSTNSVNCVGSGAYVFIRPSLCSGDTCSLVFAEVVVSNYLLTGQINKRYELIQANQFSFLLRRPITIVSACNAHGCGPGINISTTCDIPATGDVTLTSDCILHSQIVVTGKLNVTGVPDANGVLPKIIGGGSNRLFTLAEGCSLFLSNLNLTGGNNIATAWPDYGGGAVGTPLNNGNLPVQFVCINCVISGNSAKYGAGINIQRGNVSITNTVFENNGNAWFGGGMVCNAWSNCLVRDCVFRGNLAQGYGTIINVTVQKYTTSRRTVLPCKPNVLTMATPTRFVPPAKIPMRASYALRTVPQALTRQEYSITHALHVPAEPLPVCGINTDVNHGPIASAASTSLLTAQVPLTVYVVAAGWGNFPHLPTPIIARTGKVA
eukprot:g7483.t1